MNLFNRAWWKAEVEITEKQAFWFGLAVIVALVLNSLVLGLTLGKLACR